MTSKIIQSTQTRRLALAAVRTVNRIQLLIIEATDPAEKKALVFERDQLIQQCRRWGIDRYLF